MGLDVANAIKAEVRGGDARIVHIYENPANEKFRNLLKDDTPASISNLNYDDSLPTGSPTSSTKVYKIASAEEFVEVDFGGMSPSKEALNSSTASSANVLVRETEYVLNQE